MNTMKEFTDWEVYVKDLAVTIIHECKEHAGKPSDIVKEIVKGALSEKMRNEVIEAVKGSMEIPAEFKNAGLDGWFELLTNVVVQVPEFIEAFQTKPLEVPETPVV